MYLVFDGHTVYENVSAREIPAHHSDLLTVVSKGSYDTLEDLPEYFDSEGLYVAPSELSYSHASWSSCAESNFRIFEAAFGAVPGVVIIGTGIYLSLRAYCENREIHRTLAALQDYPALDDVDVERVRLEAIVRAWNSDLFCRVCRGLSDYEHPTCPMVPAKYRSYELDLKDFFCEFAEAAACDVDDPTEFSPDLAVFDRVLKDLRGNWMESSEGMSAVLPVGVPFDDLVSELAYKLTDGDFDGLLKEAKEANS